MALNGNQAYILSLQKSSEIASGVENWHVENGTDIVGTTVDGGSEVRVAIPHPEVTQSEIKNVDVGGKEEAHLFLTMNDGSVLDAGEIPAGMSAYDIAVKLGFSGTEEEWLESLKSERASKTFTFNTPTATWELQHNFNQKFVQVYCFDADGDTAIGNVEYKTADLVIVTWDVPIAGTAVVK